MPDLFEPDVELRWRGKQTKVKTVSLPFQAAEHIDLGGSDWQWEGVEAWSRVVPFEIPCYDEEHGFHCYIPDFIVRADGRYYLAETEGAGFARQRSRGYATFAGTGERPGEHLRARCLERREMRDG